MSSFEGRKRGTNKFLHSFAFLSDRANERGRGGIAG